MKNVDNSVSLKKKTYSFAMLFDKTLEGIDYIRIPIIQRDYVQGRVGVEEVRDEFINALRDKLVLDENELTNPIDLDFIYGYTETEVDTKIFYPLDGQQRLTTLFLLHWYIACKNGEFAKFTELFSKDKKSVFSYQTRPSSDDFFNELVNQEFDFSMLGVDSLSSAIIDKKWFFLSWRNDPTIDSVLRMLDKIHQIFRCKNVPFSRLASLDKPYITFQFLDMKNSGFSDDLYIKMNARGKPLTPFENFKARFEQYIKKNSDDNDKKTLNNKEVSLNTYFSHKIDTEWADTFWNYKNTYSVDNSSDDEIMNFIRTFMAVFYPRIASDEKDVLRKLLDKNQEFSFYAYEEHGCLNSEIIKYLIEVFDGICDGSAGIKNYLQKSDYYDEQRIFEDIIKYSITNKQKFSNEKAVQFYAYCLYIISHQNQQIESDKIYEWMRIIANLAKNTRIEIDEFRKTLVTVKQLIEHADNILDFIVDNADDITDIQDNDSRNKFKGFNRQQIREERIKAMLILKSEKWRDLIIKAETHGYFEGQVEFLLKFTGILDYYIENDYCNWTQEEDKLFIERFSEYYEKAIAVFDESGLKPELSGPYGKSISEIGKNGNNEFIFERALLSCGDYMLNISNNRKSFLDNSDRDYSWKRLLSGSGFKSKTVDIDHKRGYLKELFDKIDNTDIYKSLCDIVYSRTITDNWKELFINQPALIQACSPRRRIYVDNQYSPLNDIFLLTKTRIDCWHLEAYTYKLLIDDLMPMKKQGEIVPFTEAKEYMTCSSSERPFVYLTGWNIEGNNLNLNIFFENGTWRLELLPQCECLIPEELASIIISDIGFEDPKKYNDEEDDLKSLIYKDIPKNDIKESLIKTIATLKDYDSIHAQNFIEQDIEHQE